LQKAAKTIQYFDRLADGADFTLLPDGTIGLFTSFKLPLASIAGKHIAYLSAISSLLTQSAAEIHSIYVNVI